MFLKKIIKILLCSWKSCQFIAKKSSHNFQLVERKANIQKTTAPTLSPYVFWGEKERTLNLTMKIFLCSSIAGCWIILPLSPSNEKVILYSLLKLFTLQKKRNSMNVNDMRILQLWMQPSHNQERNVQ